METNKLDKSDPWINLPKLTEQQRDESRANVLNALLSEGEEEKRLNSLYSVLRGKVNLINISTLVDGDDTVDPVRKKELELEYERFKEESRKRAKEFEEEIRQCLEQRYEEFKKNWTANAG